MYPSGVPCRTFIVHPPYYQLSCCYESCQQLLEQTWRFCPNCGTDQTPHREKPDQAVCPHEIEADGPFCTVCGFDAEAPFGLQPAQRLPMGIAACVGALLLLLVDGYILANPSDKGIARIASYAFLPALVLLWFASRLLVPRRTERMR